MNKELIVLENVGVKEPFSMSSNSYVTGPLVITPEKVSTNNGDVYIGIQSCIWHDHDDKPELRLWYLEMTDVDNHIIVNSQYDTDEVVEFGKQIAIILINKLLNEEFSKEEYQKILDENYKFSKEYHTSSPYNTFADVFIKEHTKMGSLYIDDKVIDDIIESINL